MSQEESKLYHFVAISFGSPEETADDASDGVTSEVRSVERQPAARSTTGVAWHTIPTNKHAGQTPSADVARVVDTLRKPIDYSRLMPGVPTGSLALLTNDDNDRVPNSRVPDVSSDAKTNDTVTVAVPAPSFSKVLFRHNYTDEAEYNRACDKFEKDHCYSAAIASRPWVKTYWACDPQFCNDSKCRAHQFPGFPVRAFYAIDVFRAHYRDPNYGPRK